MGKVVKMSADDLKKALARRHKEDMFFTEVKDGPTQSVAHHSKIDALAMKISWTSFAITGYEIKVSRSDFMRDDKWQAYLPMCNYMYFVVAPGVCDVQEISDNCGLIVATEKGGLRTVRKAPWRDIEHPTSMYMYLMFTYIGAYRDVDGQRPRGARLLNELRVEDFKDYLEGKLQFKAIGHSLSMKLRDERWELERKLLRLENRLDDDKRYNQELGDICEALGVSRNGYYRGHDCIQVIAQLRKSGGILQKEADSIRKIAKLSSELLNELERDVSEAEELH